MNTVLLLLGVMAATPLDVSVTPMRGDPVTGQLVELTTTKIVIQTSDGTQALESNDLLLARPAAAATTLVPRSENVATVVTLTDGSVLHAAKYTVASRRALIELLDGTELTVPTRAVDYVRLMPQTPETFRQWQELLEEERTSDAIVIRKTANAENEPDASGAQIALDAPKGILGDIDDAAVGFAFDDSAVNVPLSKVDGLIYFHRTTSAPRDPMCRVTDASGSRWSARSLKLDGDALSGISVSGVRFTVPVTKLVTLDYSVGNIDYLSDLPRESVVWKPFVSLGTPPSAYRWFSPKFDTGLYGSVLKLEDEPFEKGIALHSRAEITYRLTKRYRRLMAKVGVDDAFRYEANLELRIYGDSDLIFSRHIKGNDDPFDLDLDMQGVRRLKIVVDYGEDDSERGDNLNLCNARLTK